MSSVLKVKLIGYIIIKTDMQTEHMKVSDETIVFATEKHIEYIRKVSSDKESFEYLVTQHLRMSGVYWGLTASSLLGLDIKNESSFDGMIDWVMQCQDHESGG